MIENNKAAINWTVGKLINVVLLTVVLALMIYGLSSGGLGPLIDNLEAKFDEVQILFGFG